MVQSPKAKAVEKWGIFELALSSSLLKRPARGNPFRDVQFGASFTFKHQTVHVDGFYDGDGVYCVRFMPDEIGPWSYVTHSNAPRLDGVRGTFLCTPPSAGNHGPVDVYRYFHFVHADGERHYPFGTTCYAWIHQPPALRAQTLRTLARSPFNKLRMCVFPKHYVYNTNEPDCFPFLQKPQKPQKHPPRRGRERDQEKWSWDLDRFDVRFWRKLDRCVERLGELGIQADLILFHPYDRWGFANLDAQTEERYLKYLIARLAAYRNVWWSMANEWDFMKAKTVKDFDRYFRIVRANDPYGHLRSVHNGRIFYDHTKPWVTHCSVQHADLAKVTEWREQYVKPVVVDECGYEGDIERRWGNLPGWELVHRVWMGVVRGGYVGHGETFLHPQDVLWWSKGGRLYGQSARRIAFLRRILEQAPRAALEPVSMGRGNDALARPGEYYLFYYGLHQPAKMPMDLPAGGRFRVELIDTWRETIRPLAGTFKGKFTLKLPGKPFMAVRMTKVR